jgi:hypothetical protein
LPKEIEGLSKDLLNITRDGNVLKELTCPAQTLHLESFEKLMDGIFLPFVLLVWLNSSQDIDGDRAERCNQRSSRAAEASDRQQIYMKTRVLDRGCWTVPGICKLSTGRY